MAKTNEDIVDAIDRLADAQDKNLDESQIEKATIAALKDLAKEIRKETGDSKFTQKAINEMLKGSKSDSDRIKKLENLVSKFLGKASGSKSNSEEFRELSKILQKLSFGTSKSVAFSANQRSEKASGGELIKFTSNQIAARMQALVSAVLKKLDSDQGTNKRSSQVERLDKQSSSTKFEVPTFKKEEINKFNKETKKAMLEPVQALVKLLDRPDFKKLKDLVGGGTFTKLTSEQSKALLKRGDARGAIRAETEAREQRVIGLSRNIRQLQTERDASTESNTKKEIQKQIDKLMSLRTQAKDADDEFSKAVEDIEPLLDKLENTSLFKKLKKNTQDIAKLAEQAANENKKADESQEKASESTIDLNETIEKKAKQITESSESAKVAVDKADKAVKNTPIPPVEPPKTSKPKTKKPKTPSSNVIVGEDGEIYNSTPIVGVDTSARPSKPKPKGKPKKKVEEENKAAKKENTEATKEETKVTKEVTQTKKKAKAATKKATEAKKEATKETKKKTSKSSETGSKSDDSKLSKEITKLTKEIASLTKSIKAMKSSGKGSSTSKKDDDRDRVAEIQAKFDGQVNVLNAKMQSKQQDYDNKLAALEKQLEAKEKQLKEQQKAQNKAIKAQKEALKEKEAEHKRKIAEIKEKAKQQRATNRQKLKDSEAAKTERENKKKAEKAEKEAFAKEKKLKAEAEKLQKELLQQMEKYNQFHKKRNDQLQKDYQKEIELQREKQQQEILRNTMLKRENAFNKKRAEDFVAAGGSLGLQQANPDVSSDDPNLQNFVNDFMGKLFGRESVLSGSPDGFNPFVSSPDSVRKTTGNAGEDIGFLSTQFNKKGDRNILQAKEALEQQRKSLIDIREEAKKLGLDLSRLGIGKLDADIEEALESFDNFQKRAVNAQKIFARLIAERSTLENNIKFGLSAEDQEKAMARIKKINSTIAEIGVELQEGVNSNFREMAKLADSTTSSVSRLNFEIKKEEQRLQTIEAIQANISANEAKALGIQGSSLEALEALEDIYSTITVANKKSLKIDSDKLGLIEDQVKELKKQAKESVEILETVDQSGDSAEEILKANQDILMNYKQIQKATRLINTDSANEQDILRNQEIIQKSILAIEKTRARIDLRTKKVQEEVASRNEVESEEKLLELQREREKVLQRLITRAGTFKKIAVSSLNSVFGNFLRIKLILGTIGIALKTNLENVLRRSFDIMKQIVTLTDEIKVIQSSIGDIFNPSGFQEGNRAFSDQITKAAQNISLGLGAIGNGVKGLPITFREVLTTVKSMASIPALKADFLKNIQSPEDVNRRLKELQNENKIRGDEIPADELKRRAIVIEDQVQSISKSVLALQAIDPTQTTEGALFSLREALSGDFISLKKRFEIQPEFIAQQIGKSVEFLKKNPTEFLKGLESFFQENFSNALKTQIESPTGVVKRIQSSLEIFAVDIGKGVGGKGGFNETLRDEILTPISSVLVELFEDDSLRKDFINNINSFLRDGVDSVKKIGMELFSIIQEFFDLGGIAGNTRPVVQLTKVLEIFVKNTTSALKTLLKVIEDNRGKIIDFLKVARNTLETVIDLFGKLTVVFVRDFIPPALEIFKSLTDSPTKIKVFFTAFLLGIGNSANLVFSLAGGLKDVILGLRELGKTKAFNDLADKVSAGAQLTKELVKTDITGTVFNPRAARASEKVNLSARSSIFVADALTGLGGILKGFWNFLKSPFTSFISFFSKLKGFTTGLTGLVAAIGSLSAVLTGGVIVSSLLILSKKASENDVRLFEASQDKNLYNALSTFEKFQVNMGMFFEKTADKFDDWTERFFKDFKVFFDDLINGIGDILKKIPKLKSFFEENQKEKIRKQTFQKASNSLDTSDFRKFRDNFIKLNNIIDENARRREFIATDSVIASGNGINRNFSKQRIKENENLIKQSQTSIKEIQKNIFESFIENISLKDIGFSKNKLFGRNFDKEFQKEFQKLANSPRLQFKEIDERTSKIIAEIAFKKVIKNSINDQEVLEKLKVLAENSGLRGMEGLNEKLVEIVNKLTKSFLELNGKIKKGVIPKEVIGKIEKGTEQGVMLFNSIQESGNKLSQKIEDGSNPAILATFERKISNQFQFFSQITDSFTNNILRLNSSLKDLEAANVSKKFQDYFKIAEELFFGVTEIDKETKTQVTRPEKLSQIVSNAREVRKRRITDPNTSKELREELKGSLGLVKSISTQQQLAIGSSLIFNQGLLGQSPDAQNAFGAFQGLEKGFDPNNAEKVFEFLKNAETVKDFFGKFISGTGEDRVLSFKKLKNNESTKGLANVFADQFVPVTKQLEKQAQSAGLSVDEFREAELEKVVTFLTKTLITSSVPSEEQFKNIRLVGQNAAKKEVTEIINEVSNIQEKIKFSVTSKESIISTIQKLNKIRDKGILGELSDSEEKKLLSRVESELGQTEGSLPERIAKTVANLKERLSEVILSDLEKLQRKTDAKLFNLEKKFRSLDRSFDRKIQSFDKKIGGFSRRADREDPFEDLRIRFKTSSQKGERVKTDPVTNLPLVDSIRQFGGVKFIKAQREKFTKAITSGFVTNASAGKSRQEFVEDIKSFANGIGNLDELAQETRTQLVQLKEQAKRTVDSTSEEIKRVQLLLKEEKNEDKIKRLNTQITEFQEQSKRANELIVGIDNLVGSKELDKDIDEIREAIQALLDQASQKEEDLKDFNFSRNFKRGLDKAQEDFGTFDEQLNIATYNTAQNMANTMDNVFFNVLKGQTESAKQAWKDFMGSVKDEFFRALAQMIRSQLVKQLFRIFGFSGGGDVPGLKNGVTQEGNQYFSPTGMILTEAEAKGRAMGGMIKTMANGGMIRKMANGGMMLNNATGAFSKSTLINVGEGSTNPELVVNRLQFGNIVNRTIDNAVQAMPQMMGGGGKNIVIKNNFTTNISGGNSEIEAKVQQMFMQLPDLMEAQLQQSLNENTDIQNTVQQVASQGSL